MTSHRARFPDRVGPQQDPADEFLRLACLTYGADDPVRWANARALLSARPGLVDDNVFVAAACANASALERLLTGGPRLANAEGGPFGWPPLLYLTYARHDPEITEEAVLRAAATLMDSGADPDASFLWHDLEPPFTALTGALGSGEGGDELHPQHPHGFALAELLLDAGADPDDGQALYNRMFERDDRHLELLLDHELSDPGLLASQLSWAVSHGFDDRVRLLHRYDLPLDEPLHDFAAGGRTAWQLARWTGQRETAELLAQLGVAGELAATDAVVAAVLAGERPSRSVTEARTARPGLVAWAAALNHPHAVRRAVEAGWDVNRRSRVDIPSDEEWESALHVAAGQGNEPMVRLLLQLGADPGQRDHRFDGTPLDWAEHFGSQDIVRLLSDRSG